MSASLISVLSCERLTSTCFDNRFKLRVPNECVLAGWGRDRTGAGAADRKRWERLPDGDQRELPDDERDDLQSAKEAAARHAHQDRLEQDCGI